MEHIMQFGISIDDEKIENEIIGQAAKSVNRQCEKFAEGWKITDSKLGEMFQNRVDEVIKANKEKIIDAAVEKLTANLAKTKAVKEALKKAGFE